MITARAINLRARTACLLAAIAFVLSALPALRCSALADRESRLRVVVMTDFPPVDAIPGGAGYGPPEKRSDTDDLQSMVRFLAYSNEFDVEALIATSGTFANIARKKNLLDMLTAYSAVYPALKRHDARYLAPDLLRQRCFEGRSGTYGKPAPELIGAGRNSEASEAIIRLLEQPDTRPIWFCMWGGPADLAQALWKISNTRPQEAATKLLNKVRIYLIGKQDGSAQWMLDTFPDLFVILSTGNYMGMFNNASGSDGTLSDIAWIEAHVRKNHGALGAAYPRSGFYPDSPGVWEGDTPSFLYLLSATRGLNNPEHPEEASWGGCFTKQGPTGNHWIDAPGGAQNVWRWRMDVQNDFEARMNWCVTGREEGVSPPIITLHMPAIINAAPGETIKLSASASGTDAHQTACTWSIAAECQPLCAASTLANRGSAGAALFKVPDLPGEALRLILSATASGASGGKAIRYASVVVKIKGKKP